MMLRVVYDPAFDEGAWPGPCPEPGAVAGEVWVGTAGLVGLLEGRLGLRGPAVGAARRAASLSRRLASHTGFWSRSAQVDPLGTASRLLQWRDALALAGWEGQPVSTRLRDLWAVTEGLPALAERLRAILESNPEVDLEVLSLPATRLERQLLERLAGWPRAPKEATSPGDLGAARRGAFEPARDGTLQLLRPPGPLRAAEELAAWLAAQPSPEGTVVVTPQPVLDAALRRHGLPTTGAREAGGTAALLQALPLVLACGWDPPDPERALELLTLGVGPIRPRVARELVKALHEWPAVGSEAWNAALEGEDVAGFLHGEVDRQGGYPASVACRRAERLADWVRGRLATEEGDLSPWHAAAQQASEFLALVRESGLESLSEGQLQRLVAQATEAAGAPQHPACAGIHALGHPGGLAGPARRVVWWDFTLATVGSPTRLPLTLAEQQGLRALGVELPDPGAVARAEAERWRRPLLHAAEALVLVCPQPEFPHPLWDEIAVRAGDQAHRLEAPRPFGGVAPTRVRRDLRATARPRRRWSVPAGTVGAKAKESPSSLGKLIGCPFAWAVQYGGGVWAGRTGPLPGEATLLGKLAHEILERVLPEAVGDPDTAGARAAALFDRLGPTLAAPLFLPGADAARAQARHVAASAADALARHLADAGMRVLHVEAYCHREGLDGLVDGRIDLVVGPPETILDLKWSGSGRFVQLMREGTAYQLATYSYLRGNGHMPPVGYFTLVDGTLLTHEKGLFREARVVEGPPPGATWAGVESAVRARRAELETGLLDAPGADGTGTDEDGLVEGRLVLAPSCRWCDCHVLCGATLADEEVSDEDAF